VRRRHQLLDLLDADVVDVDLHGGGHGETQRLDGR
jgi:hypothetical protein